MTFSSIDPGHLLAAYLRLSPVLADGGASSTSAFAAAVGDARVITGRDENGRVRPGRERESARWIGGVAWLCLIEQVGHAIRLKKTSVSDRGSNAARFKGCLADFAPANIREGSIPHTLWLLRNSLAHNFALYNEPHKFVLDCFKPETGLEVVWADHGYTVVNLWALGDLGEQIVFNIQQAEAAGKVEFGLPLVEVAKTYFMTYGGEVGTRTTLNSASSAATGTIEYVSTASASASASALPPGDSYRAK